MNSTRRHLPSSLSFPSTFAVAVLLAACATQPEPTGTAAETAKPVPPPLAALDGTAYATGMRVKLPKVPPKEEPGLHNVYGLSDTIVSGSEPHGEEAFQKIKEMGVKTILSVDGKVPDEALARKYGMTYVHVPIQYRGITDEEIAKIAKTFREKRPPFYVHCFHGKHRGPAAAEIGRIALDGIPRDQALAEMRQWCGTSETYEGLYKTIAQASIPTALESRAYPFSFPAAHPIEGFRTGMIDAARNDDNLKLLSKRKWQADPAHPDVVAQEEATQLADTLERCAKLDSVASKPQDFREWMADSVTASAALRDALRVMKGGSTSPSVADQAYKELTAACNSCHAAYRN
jgi:protein tyrosine phosphatase (PTP) superfamily phosphohydrolase (DUF442 family)